ncbi:hypothetical protein CAPTEDRAFT_217329 [Capitella teleta]|uniref:Uncharacterized protein n=1 Tax=Capitella teleta TaxID=283909 RepID=R7VEA4_CAPTE|nr:hypothetical protein CAPTEDRAFT_217329 [Capitella teleta]|eukprot:ELU16964.1 hypothetical protein CAPTEDRAFT_217329 [Capitella teleta]
MTDEEIIRSLSLEMDPVNIFSSYLPKSFPHDTSDGYSAVYPVDTVYLSFHPEEGESTSESDAKQTSASLKCQARDERDEMGGGCMQTPFSTSRMTSFVIQLDGAGQLIPGDRASIEPVWRKRRGNNWRTLADRSQEFHLSMAERRNHSEKLQGHLRGQSEKKDVKQGCCLQGDSVAIDHNSPSGEVFGKRVASNYGGGMRTDTESDA